MAEFKLNGFKYFINGEEIEDFDTWEKYIKKNEVRTTVKNLEVHADKL